MIGKFVHQKDTKIGLIRLMVTCIKRFNPIKTHQGGQLILQRQ